MRPYAIEQRLKLRNPIYEETAAYGHMGRVNEVVTKPFCHLTEMKLYWKWSSSLGRNWIMWIESIGLRIIKSKPPEFQEAFFMKKGIQPQSSQGIHQEKQERI